MANESVSHASMRAQSPIIHPIWAVLAIPALALLLFSDVSNNLSIVDRFASGTLSLMSWQSLSIGVALAAGVLGFAASRKWWYWLPCVGVTIISGCLTMLSVGTDFESKSADATNYQQTTQGLIQEREQLLNSLNGTPPCSAQSWCDSQAKERRVSEINMQLAMTPAAVDPISTPHGEIFAQAIAWLRAFAIPFITAILGNLLGEIFRGSFRNPKSATDPIVGGSFQEKKSETSHTYKKKIPRETSAEDAVERAREWLQEQPAGRISKEKLKVASKVRGHKTTARVIELLIAAGELVRYDNGQLAKPQRSLRVVK